MQRASRGSRARLSGPGTRRIFSVDTHGGRNMRAKIQKWGTSLALRIPESVAKEAGLENGGEVELEVRDGRLVVSQPRQRLSFEEMCARVTEENRHGEIDSGPPVGNEAW